MSGFVDIVINVQLKFTAKALITATGKRWKKDGTIADAPIDGLSIEAILRTSNFDYLTVQKVNNDSVLINVSGKMMGNYVVNTQNVFKKIA